MSSAATNGQQTAPTSIPSINRMRQDEKRKKNTKALFWIAVPELVLGLISCVFGVVTLGEDDNGYFVYANSITRIGAGIWCGFALIISGILGVAARLCPTKLMYRANLCLSILSIVAMVTLLLISSIAASTYFHRAFNIALALLAIVGVVVSSTHTCYSYVEIPSKKRHGGRVMYRAVPQQQLIPVQMPNGQIVYYPSQNIPSTVYHPSNVQTVNVPAPVSYPNLNQPMNVAQTVYPPNMQTSYAPMFQSYDIPPAYPTPAAPPIPVISTSHQGQSVENHPPEYVMPTPAVPTTVLSQPSQQVSVAQDTKQPQAIPHPSSAPPPTVNADSTLTYGN